MNLNTNPILEQKLPNVTKIDKWSGKGEVKMVISSVLAHLVNTEHHADANKAFSVIHCVPKTTPRVAHQRLLKMAAAVAMRLVLFFISLFHHHIILLYMYHPIID
ncbi:unnamed protein product [Heterobilharzia americana]|nr:unnamed protein product [Heterobilharzia americana]